jgi:hypothetical protein
MTASKLCRRIPGGIVVAVFLGFVCRFGSRVFSSWIGEPAAFMPHGPGRMRNLPSAEQLREVNDELRLQVVERRRVELTREEAVGQYSHQLLHSEFSEPLELIQEQLERTGTWEGELVHRKRDGSRVVVSSLWVLHRDATGKPVRVLQADTDITVQKDAEERLARQAEELARQAEELVRSRVAR